jgi:hypothetical protein
MQKKHHEGRGLLADVPIELLPCGQRRKGCPELALGLAVNAPRTAKALPLPEQGQGHHFAPAQSGLWSWGWLRGQRELAKIIRHNVKSRQEGVHLDPSICSLSWGRESHAIGRRPLPFNPQWSTHTKRSSGVFDL